MKKLLIAIILLIACPVWATTWYAQGTTPTFSHVSGTTISDVWNDAANGSGNWLDWSANPHTGDIFDANAVTGIIVDVDPAGTHDGGKVVLNTPSGGTFVHTTGNITITSDIGVSGNTGTTDVLAISGGTVTVLGNIYGGGTANADGLVISGSSTTVTIGSSGSPVTIIGGSNSSCFGVNDSHTTTTTTVYANITSGSNITAYGYSDTGTSGRLNITGNVTGASTRGLSSNRSSSGTCNVTGTCTGSSTALDGYGCVGVNTSGIVLTGNIVNGTRTVGTAGSIRWTPTAPSNGVNGHYIKFDGGGTAVYVGKNTETQSKANTDFYYFISSSATSQAGTDAGSTGGGAWGF